MIPLSAFRRLRLADVVSDQAVSMLEDWEFLGRIWMGEALGFTEWLRPIDDADNLGCLSLDLRALPQECREAILKRLDLPFRPDMSRSEIEHCLGEPLRREAFVAGRATYYFRLGGADTYVISCTFEDETNLTYLVLAPVGMGLE